MSGLEVRDAAPKDVDTIVETLTEAAGWLLARGIRQWPDPFPRDWVEALVGRGEFFVARLEGRVAGTLVLRWSDPAFWGERPDDAGYVHALAVRRAFAGRGLGERLLAWAEERVIAAGREYLRLDCLARNEKLRRYYQGLGFEPRGEAVVEDSVTALYERRCRARAEGAGRTGMPSALSRDSHARFPSIRSQRERGWTASPTHEGGGALLD